MTPASFLIDGLLLLALSFFVSVFSLRKLLSSVSRRPFFLHSRAGVSFRFSLFLFSSSVDYRMSLPKSSGATKSPFRRPASLSVPHPSHMLKARCVGGVREARLSNGRAPGRDAKGAGKRKTWHPAVCKVVTLTVTGSTTGRCTGCWTSSCTRCWTGGCTCCCRARRAGAGPDGALRRSRSGRSARSHRLRTSGRRPSPAALDRL
jgi:hypothetical protein